MTSLGCIGVASLCVRSLVGTDGADVEDLTWRVWEEVCVAAVHHEIMSGVDL